MIRIFAAWQRDYIEENNMLLKFLVTLYDSPEIDISPAGPFVSLM